MEKEPKSEQIIVSERLEKALLSSGQETVDVPKLVLAVLSQEGLGKRSLEVVSKGHFSKSDLISSLRHAQTDSEASSKITVGGKEVSITSGVVSLLEEAQNQAKGNLCVDTGHIIQAELGRIDSVLLESFNLSKDAQEELGAVLSNFIKIARDRKEYPQETKSINKLDIETTSVNSHIIDMIANAKAGMYNGEFVNNEWTLALIQSVSSHQVTILMTEHEAEVDIAMRGLSQELANHNSEYMDIPRVIAPTEAYLTENPDAAIAEAVREASGGVLILPGDPRYLTHKAVRVALGQKKIRLISFAAEKSWQKIKSTIDRIGGKELFLSSPSEKMVSDMLTAQKSTLEALYSQRSNGESGLKLTISKGAITEASKLGYRYASVMDMPAILAAHGLLKAAATNLKLAHSGMGKLISSLIRPDQIVDKDDVYVALKTLTGIEIQPEDPTRFLHMEDELRKEIVGQEEAISIVSDTIRRSETALRDPKRPRGVFMFLGPSGVGKTELAKTLSQFMFHDDRSYIQLNMSEYQEQHAVARLIGAPPGYVGYEEGGQLTEKVRKQPYSIVVVDEMEKANSKVFDVFLQVFEEGLLTDGKGRTVDFSNTILILTGNIGSEYFEDVDSRGFAAVKEDVLKEAQAIYRPEFLNRIDNMVVFKPLSTEAISKIVDIQVQKLNKRLEESGIKIELTPDMHKFLETVGYEPKYGARPLRRAVEKYIGNNLTQKLLSKSYKVGDVVVADYKDKEVFFTSKKK